MINGSIAVRDAGCEIVVSTPAEWPFGAPLWIYRALADATLPYLWKRVRRREDWLFRDVTDRTQSRGRARELFAPLQRNVTAIYNVF
jgi:hypothetical protein